MPERCSRSIEAQGFRAKRPGKPLKAARALASLRGAAAACLAVGVCLLGSPVFANDLVFGDPAVWRSAPSRSYHVENYRLTLHFNQAAGEVMGDEIVTLKPFAAGFRRFYLDSADMVIESVLLLVPRGPPVRLAFEQQDHRLWITLDRDYASTDRLRVRVAYHGSPRFGLFFENPDADHPDRLPEIWSQGESEFNHHWFPCWDYPNDMATSETITTVPEGQVVVSNGRLRRVTHAGGTVTYDWVEGIPHSSYLISLAVGPWQTVHDSYQGKPVDYYVPRGTSEASARRGFGQTPDMIGFFSRLLINYPYEKYAQVAVREFGFGGQENVSATTLRESSVLQDSQAASDYPDTELIAHELAQHWLGDYVQAQDWADIWLNEGFATYLPALYTQYRDGYDAYRLQMAGYQDTAKTQDQRDYVRAIVDHHYTDDGMQMVDETTHEKGAAVLDMMRYVLDGSAVTSRLDPATSRFFGALRHYLVQHAHQSVDTGDLVRATRAATGQELDWFFHQWVYMAGAPAYQVAAEYHLTSASETVTVSQTQRGRNVPPVFDMPVELVFHGSHGESLRIQVRNDQPRQTYTVPLGFEPLWVDFDPDNFIEKTLDFPQSLAALVAAATEDPSMMARWRAASELGKVHGSEEPETASRALDRVLADDAFYGVRIAAAASLGQLKTSTANHALIVALSQSDSRVRGAAASALGELRADPEAYAALVQTLRNDRSYAVRAAAASSIGKAGTASAFDLLRTAWSAQPEMHLVAALDAAMAGTGDPRAGPLLLADAKPGISAARRLAALSALPALRDTLKRDHTQELTDVVSDAMHDSYLPLAITAERLVVALDLVQLKPDLVASASSAPTLWQREATRKLLQQMDSRESQSPAATP